MSTRRRLSACALLLGVALGACSSEDGEGADGPGGSFPSLAPAEPSRPGQATTLDPATTAGTETCELVRAGIDAFNEGDYEETVERFAAALPVAEDAAAEPDAAAEVVLLLEAVRYYAELPPEDYADASQGSPDFETNKQITLGLCVTEGAPLAPPSSGGPGDPGVEA